MSVLIKGIKMPKCCADCPCFYDFISCQVLFEGTDDFSMSGFDEWKMRLPNCPLVEIPPHGRLIDADNLVSVIDDEFTEQTRTLSNPIEVLKKAVLCGFAKDVITAAPTIIEVEEGEEA